MDHPVVDEILTNTVFLNIKIQ